MDYPTPFLTLPDAGYAQHQLKKSNDVGQLTNAQQLAQDAFQRVSSPTPNPVDQLRAQDEMEQAVETWYSVMPDLSQDQITALSSIINTEWSGFVDSSLGSQYGKGELQLGAQMNQSLIDWILSE